MKIEQQKILIENVDKGAAYLDKHRPDWYTKVDLSDFDMSSGRNCVCGWVFKDMVGQIVNGTSISNGYDGFIFKNPHVEPAKHGFVYDLQLMNTNPDGSSCDEDYVTGNQQYSFLAELWVEKIEKRLANDGLLS